MNLNILLIFCAGFTFAVGGLNLAISSSYKKDRSYLYFGFLSLFASVFLLTGIISSSSDMVDALSIFSAVMFYGLFIWFIGEYTGYKLILVQRIISALILIVFLTYFLIDASVISWEIWEFIAHFAIICISIYGLVAGRKGLRNYNVFWKSSYMFFMLVLLLSALVIGLQESFGVGYDIGSIGGITILDFFPVFFSLIVGSKMSSDIVLSYYLDLKVKQKEKEWSELLETINLLIVKLNCDGKIIWVNSFLKKFTGYQEEELIGKNWIEVMTTEENRKELNRVFDSLVGGTELPVFKNSIRTHEGKLKEIQWSNLLLKSTEGKTIGVLSMGADISQLEHAYLEIRQLKDQLEKENLLLKEEVKWKELTSDIIGESDTLMYVIKRAHQVAGTDSTVLLEGETGVGKELFANLIHENSMRKHRPFIKVNCASLPKELIESELFGHEKGAFTGALRTRQGRFELADRGTIFLDEIGELPLELQPKLLRVLQSGEFERIGSEQTKKIDVRVISATNRNLQEESEKGVFRQDLFFRLNVYPITIPPLRQRIEDIPALTKHFTAKIGRKIGRKIKHISKADISKLQDYDWPGNVRELENVLERAIINSESDTIKIDSSRLKSSFLPAGKAGFLAKSRQHEKAELTLSANQKNHIIAILEECDWRINGDQGAAIKLGMPPSTLRSKMKKLGIERPQKRT